MTAEDVEAMFRHLLKAAEKGEPKTDTVWIGTRGVA